SDTWLSKEATSIASTSVLTISAMGSEHLCSNMPWSAVRTDSNCTHIRRIRKRALSMRSMGSFLSNTESAHHRRTNRMWNTGGGLSARHNLAVAPDLSLGGSVSQSNSAIAGTLDSGHRMSNEGQ